MVDDHGFDSQRELHPENGQDRLRSSRADIRYCALSIDSFYIYTIQSHKDPFANHYE